MLRLRRKSIALFVIVCTLFLNGLVYAQTIEHESHHAHHQAATHSSVLCSWMCAAGNMLDAVHFVPQMHFDLLALDLVSGFQAPSSQPVESPTSRGPPVRSI